MQLDDPLSKHFRILPAQGKALKKLNLVSVRDLLYYFPNRYTDTADVSQIASLKKGETAVIFGTISGLKTSKGWRKKIPMAEAILEDETGRVKIVWFHQAYLAKMIAEGSAVRVEGRVSERGSKLYFTNPKVERVPTLFDQRSKHSLYPIYPETRGISSSWIYHKIQNIFNSGVLDAIVDPIPQKILENYHLPRLKTALIYIHSPKKKEHAQVARKRLSFEEIFFIQLERVRAKEFFRTRSSWKIERTRSDLDELIVNFPFSPTQAQERAIARILEDLSKTYPMSRLLEGDVGSGKTAVAAAATYAVVTSKPEGQNFGTLQTAYMAPTEILAQQHFESFIKYFSSANWRIPINIALITGSGCKKFPSKINPEGWTNISRNQLLKWVQNGEIAVVVGTHALIQKSVKFKHLALAIIDEQHRFGVNQRQKLVSKDEKVPHLLSMTATPIPRTLALTMYGDLDLTLLDEMPLGRKPIITKAINPLERASAYEEVRRELKDGRQAYVICPRINPVEEQALNGASEPKIEMRSVKTEAKRLKKEVFPEYEIEILHSKMSAQEKERIMIDFKAHKFDILVSTSVVEVGVNVENASVIIIEGAERFGLSQLHQLRGRVLRGTHQPYCFVFTESKSKSTEERLEALLTAKNGFELAEYDLKQRGAGLLSGTKQWGISDLGMEAIQNLKMVEAARREAAKLVTDNYELDNYPEIKMRLDSKATRSTHFE